MPAGYGQQFRLRHGKPRSPSEPQLYLLPTGHVPFVAVRTRELGDREPPGRVPHRCLGARAAERATCVDKVREVTVDVTLGADALGGSHEPGQVDQPWDRVPVRRTVGGGSRLAEPDTSLTGVITDAEKEVGLAEGTRCGLGGTGALALRTPHEILAPSVGGAVGERVEDG